MLALVAVQVYEVPRQAGSAEGRLHCGVWTPDECEHRTVVRRVFLDVEQVDARDPGDRLLQPGEHARVTALAEVGDALDDAHHLPTFVPLSPEGEGTGVGSSPTSWSNQAWIAGLPATIEPCRTTSGDPAA